MIVSLISAIAKNGVIGTGKGGIPWHLPRDSAHFRRYTRGKWMLLGRKTFLEMEGWFSDQIPVVLTRATDFEVSGGHRVNSVEEAVSLAEIAEVEELVVSGGGEVYRLALPLVEKLILTRIQAKIEGSVYFPEIDWCRWKLVESKNWKKDEDNNFNMRLETFKRDTAR